MKYLAGLSDLHGTVIGAAKALDNLNQISGHLAGVLMQRRMQRMGALGDGSTSAPIDFGAAFGTTNDFGLTNTSSWDSSAVVSQKPGASPGQIVTTYADGAQVITSPNRSPLTVIPSGTPTNSITDGIGTTILNVPQTLSDWLSGGLKAGASATSSVLTPIAVIGVVGLIAYFIFRSPSRR